MRNLESCELNCPELEPGCEFDRTAREEVHFSVTMASMLSNHVGWYLEISVDGIANFIRDLHLRTQPGVYLLWHALGYCDFHQKEVFRAAYVGKAGSGIESRLIDHFKTKELGLGMPVEVTIWRGINRHAKYVEQLFLDTYNFKSNGVENSGADELLISIDPGAWN